MMVKVMYYSSPIGLLLLASLEDQLIGLWIEKQKYYLSGIKDIVEVKEDPTLDQTKKWLDRYFSNQKPKISELNLKFIGTDFQKMVWTLLLEIPYGSVVTYQDIANKVAMKLGIKRMSAQAVGSAIGHNPISIIIPCHRVIGSNGNLTGYAGGIDKKSKLLIHEQVDMSKLKNKDFKEKYINIF